MDYFKQQEMDMDSVNRSDYFEPEETFNLSDVLSWLRDHIQYDMELLKKEPIITDAGSDVTGHIKARLQAYVEVKSYIERGIKGQTG